MSVVFLLVLPTTKKVEGEGKGGQEKEKGKRRMMRIGGGRKRMTLTRMIGWEGLRHEFKVQTGSTHAIFHFH